jgi:hypothetical protein
VTWGAGQTPEEGAVRLPETRPWPLRSWTSEAGRIPEDAVEGAVRLPETHRRTLENWVPGAGLYKKGCINILQKYEILVSVCTL